MRLRSALISTRFESFPSRNHVDDRVATSPETLAKPPIALIETIAFCSAVAERSGDTAFAPAKRNVWWAERVKSTSAARLEPTSDLSA